MLIFYESYGLYGFFEGIFSPKCSDCIYMKDGKYWHRDMNGLVKEQLWQNVFGSIHNRVIGLTEAGREWVLDHRELDFDDNLNTRDLVNIKKTTPNDIRKVIEEEAVEIRTEAEKLRLKWAAREGLQNVSK